MRSTQQERDMIFSAPAAAVVQPFVVSTCSSLRRLKATSNIRENRKKVKSKRLAPLSILTTHALEILQKDALSRSSACYQQGRQGDPSSRGRWRDRARQ